MVISNDDQQLKNNNYNIATEKTYTVKSVILLLELDNYFLPAEGNFLQEIHTMKSEIFDDPDSPEENIMNRGTLIQ